MHDETQGVLMSRDHKVFRRDLLPHIYAALDRLNQRLDGELYLHGVPLPQINGAVGIHRDQPNELSQRMEFHVFDINLPNTFAASRFTKIEQLSALFAPCLRLVKHVYVRTEASADEVHNANLAAGYEGTIYHNPHALYYPLRTPYMLKRKGWADDTFKVVAVCRGEGASNKHTVGSLTCITTVERHGRFFTETFGVTVADTVESAFWAQWLDKEVTGAPMIKVRYLELTPRGVPHTPIYEGRV
jgi:hypothetical protein